MSAISTQPPSSVTVAGSTQQLGSLEINGKSYRVTVRNASLTPDKETLSKIYLIAKTHIGTSTNASSIIIKRATTQIGKSSNLNLIPIISYQKNFARDKIKEISRTPTSVTQDLFNQAKDSSTTCQDVFDSLFSKQKAPSATRSTTSTPSESLSLPSPPPAATQPRPPSGSLGALATHIAPALQSSSFEIEDSEDDLESSPPLSQRSSVSSSRTSPTATTDDEADTELSTLTLSLPVTPSAEDEETQPAAKSFFSRLTSEIASFFKSKKPSQPLQTAESDPSIILEEVASEKGVPQRKRTLSSSTSQSFRTAVEDTALLSSSFF